MIANKLVQILFLIVFCASLANGQVVQRGHTGVPTALLFDGENRLLSGGTDPNVILWDTWSGKELARWQIEAPVNCLSRKPHTHQIALAAFSAESYLLDIDKPGNLHRGNTHKNKIRQVLYSPDGCLIESDYDGWVFVYNPETNKVLSQKKYPFSIYDLIPLGTGPQVLMATNSGLYLIDLPKQESKLVYSSNIPVTHIALSSSGNLVAFSQKQSDSLNLVSVLDLAHGDVRFVQRSETEIVELSYIHNDDSLLIASRDGIGIWETGSYHLLSTMRYESNPELTADRVSPGENYVAAAYIDGKILIWDLQLGKYLKTIGGKGTDLSIGSAVLSGDTAALYTAGYDGNIRRWNIAQVRQEKRFEYSNTYCPFLVDLLGNDKLLTISSDRVCIDNRSLSNFLQRENSFISHAAVAGNTKIIAYSIGDSVYVTGLTKNYTLRKYAAPRDESVFQLAISEDARQLIFTCANGDVYYCDLHSHSQRKIARFTEIYQSIDFSKNGDWVCLGQQNGPRVRVIHLSTGKISDFKIPDGSICFIKWMPDKTLITGESSGLIREWDLTGKLKATFPGHTGYITSVISSPKQRLLFTTSTDGSLRYWNSKTKKLLLTIFPTADQMDDYVAYTPDGFYMGTKQGVRSVSFLVNGSMYDFDQFDLYYNRPDTILDRIGMADANYRQFLRKLYLKRKESYKGLVDAGGVTQFANVPEVYISQDSNESVRRTTRDFEVIIDAKDSSHDLVSINTWVNGVPAFGSQHEIISQSLKSRHIDHYREHIVLSRGENIIEVAVLNENGISSLRKSMHIFYIEKE